MRCFSKKHLPDALCILGILVGIFVFKTWVLSRANSFVMDDYQHLIYDTKGPILSNLTLLPKQVYNDRPIGDVFYFLAATQMRSNYMVAHAWQLLFHIYNSLLVYYVIRKMRVSTLPSVIGTLIFATNPMSTMCVQWTSAIYDLFAMTFAISSIALLIYHFEDRSRLKFFTPAMLLICYILSVRSKEMTIFLPFLWVMLTGVYYLRRGRPLRDIGSELGIMAPSFIFLCILFLQFIVLKFGNTGPMTTDPKNPYFQSFSPLPMAIKLIRYLELYCGDKKRILALGLVFCLIFCRKIEFLIHLAMIALIMVIVLPMVNMTQQLYLYVPSFFIALMLASAIDSSFKLLPFRQIHAACSIIIIGLLGYTFWNLESGHYFNRVEWLRIAGVERGHALQFRANISYLSGNENILIYNIPPKAHNMFTFYGPGNSIRMYTGIKTIKVKTDERAAVPPAEKANYHVLINFNGGKLIFEKKPSGAPNIRYRALY